jgi:DNA-binding response OmpR family regulator
MEKANEAAPPKLPRLDGARVLLVEDDFLIGVELAAILSDAGAEIIGPVQTVKEALAFAAEMSLSAAILDIRLGERTAAPVARLLAERGVPFLFYTGQSGTDPLRAQWPASRILSKPALPLSLLTAVAAMVRDSRRSSCLASG